MSRDSAMAALTGTPAPTAPVLTEVPVTTAEEVVHTTTNADPVKDLESSRLALFAKKEAAIVRRDQELKKRELDLQDKLDRAKPFFEKGQKFEELKDSDGVEALRVLGYSDAQILNLVARATEEKKEPSTEEQARLAAQEEISKFKEQEAAKQQEIESAKHRQVLKQFSERITKTISDEPEKFEYCNYEGPAAEGLIHETIAKVLKDSDGKDLMSIKEAAELVESYYEEKDKGMSSLKKRNPVKKDVATATSDAKEAIAKIQQNAKTLTNKATVTSAATIKKPETRSEKRERLENWLRNGKPS